MVEITLSSINSENFVENDITTILSKFADRNSLHLDDAHSVIIKPNLCYYWDYSTGETTDPRLVSAIIDFIRARVGNTPILIAEADASAMRTRHAFKMLGYERMAQKKGVKLVNLSKGNLCEKEVRVNGRPLRLQVNELLCEPHLLINVPKLKYHRFVGVTCGLKNIFGAISTPRKVVYHSQLSDVIVGINKIVKSDITIVDGIIAKGKYPLKMGVLLVSSDVLLADYIVAQILGYNPNKIPHIHLAIEEEIGHLNNWQLIEDGITLKDAQGKFPKENYRRQNFSWNLQLRLLKFYSRIVGDVIPPVLT